MIAVSAAKHRDDDRVQCMATNVIKKGLLQMRWGLERGQENACVDKQQHAACTC